VGSFCRKWDLSVAAVTAVDKCYVGVLEVYENPRTLTMLDLMEVEGEGCIWSESGSKNLHMSTTMTIF
jgi:hypothetical protein